MSVKEASSPQGRQPGSNRPLGRGVRGARPVRGDAYATGLATRPHYRGAPYLAKRRSTSLHMAVSHAHFWQGVHAHSAIRPDRARDSALRTGSPSREPSDRRSGVGTWSEVPAPGTGGTETSRDAGLHALNPQPPLCSGAVSLTGRHGLDQALDLRPRHLASGVRHKQARCHQPPCATRTRPNSRAQPREARGHTPTLWTKRAMTNVYESGKPCLHLPISDQCARKRKQRYVCPWPSPYSGAKALSGHTTQATEYHRTA